MMLVIEQYQGRNRFNVRLGQFIDPAAYPRETGDHIIEVDAHEFLFEREDDEPIRDLLDFFRGLEWALTEEGRAWMLFGVTREFPDPRSAIRAGERYRLLIIRPAH